MRTTISALLLCGFLAVPALASAQDADGGVPLPDGGAVSGTDAAPEPSSTTKGTHPSKGSKKKAKGDDSGSEGTPGAMPGGASGANRSATT